MLNKLSCPLLPSVAIHYTYMYNPTWDDVISTFKQTILYGIAIKVLRVIRHSFSGNNCSCDYISDNKELEWGLEVELLWLSG